MTANPIPTTPETSALPGTPTARSTNLGDILERILDKGIVIAGDIQVNLLDIELLTIKLRLLVASVDTARQIGIDWWEHDPWLRGGPRGDRQQLDSSDRDAIEAPGPRRGVIENLEEHDHE